MTLACQSKQTSIAAIMSNETASVIASWDSDAGTRKRRRNFTRLPYARRGNFSSRAEQSRCHCKHHNMWCLGAACGEQFVWERKKIALCPISWSKNPHAVHSRLRTLRTV